MVRTCSGLELRDQDSADQLLQSNELYSPRWVPDGVFFQCLMLTCFVLFRDLENGIIGCCEIHGPIIALPSPPEPDQNVPFPKGKKHWHDCPELHKAVEGAAFIADYIKKEEEEKKVRITTIMVFSTNY